MYEECVDAVLPFLLTTVSEKCTQKSKARVCRDLVREYDLMRAACLLLHLS
jgi:hypothetical protein